VCREDTNSKEYHTKSLRRLKDFGMPMSSSMIRASPTYVMKHSTLVPCEDEDSCFMTPTFDECHDKKLSLKPRIDLNFSIGNKTYYDASTVKPRNRSHFDLESIRFPILDNDTAESEKRGDVCRNEIFRRTDCPSISLKPKYPRTPKYSYLKFVPRIATDEELVAISNNDESFPSFNGNIPEDMLLPSLDEKCTQSNHSSPIKKNHLRMRFS